MQNRVDVAVVGGGIVGLAFAWEAATRGKSVVLFERTAAAQGASIRNFGMVWPVGQTAGEWYETALRSRAKWLKLREQAGIWAAECGSLHVAHADDEDDVLREFAAKASRHKIACEYLRASDVVKRFPAIHPAELRGALYSPTEMCVDPRQAMATMPKFLRERLGVNVRFGTAVTGIDMPNVRTATGETWKADRVFVCSGADFETLFPKLWAASGMKRCKLQMMRTRPQPGSWRLGPHLAGGLTLLHYKSFELCETLPALRKRIEVKLPEYVGYGIHVMASQNHLGEVVIGDSHEYDADISPFDKPEIDDLIVNYLRRMVQLPDWEIAGRWHGIYAKHPSEVCFTAEPQAGCHVIASPGGAGMTLSFGLAEKWWEARSSECEVRNAE